MYYIHTTIKKYLLSHLILCGLLSLSANLHAALSTEQSDLQKRSHYTPSTHNVVNRSPKDWTRPINPMPTSTQHHIYPPQLLTMVTHNPDTQYYCTHLFPSHTLLPNSNTYQLNYHLIKSPFNPGISHTPLFLAQPPKLTQCTPSNVLQYVPTNSQRQHQPKIPPTTKGHNAFYNPHFSHQSHQITNTPVNSTYPTNPSAKNNSHYQHFRPNYPHSPSIPVPQLPSQKRPKSHKKISPQKNQPYLEKWFKAAKTGDTADLEALYQSYNIHVDNRDTGNYTALLLSAENGHLEAIKYLLQQGANIHAENKWHNTSLLLSIKGGHLACLKLLLQQGANIQDKNANGYTALLFSAENGHLDCLTFLLQEGVNIHHKNKWGNTALLLSAYKGRLNCIKFLIQQGAELHHKNEKSYTALLSSTESGHLDCLKHLMAEGGNIHEKNKWGNTALLLSTYKGQLSCIKYLLQQGADIHHKNEKGYTALLSSAEKGHLNCLTFLSQQGGNIHEENKWGNTALLLSTYTGQLNCVKYLLQQGADIHHKNKKGYTALLLSTESGHLDCLKFLQEQGANIHDRNHRGSTPLILSAYEGHLHCLKYLVEQGANIHHKNNKGNTALSWSAYRGYLDCVKYLVKQGAHIQDKNDNGNTPLPLSAQQGHVDYLNFFLTSVDLRSRNLQGINLSQATLPKDLSNVNFTDTTLPEALSGKNFTDAKLPKDLSNRNLTHANLTSQHFTHTNLEGTQLDGTILTDTLCDYQQCFQDHAKANTPKDDQYQWYYNNLPKDLKSIAQVYPHLSLDRHKATLLQIASGLAYLPYWKGIEFNIKVQYWSCQLILLKKKLRSDLGALLTCTLEHPLYGLNYEAENYCWQTDYPQDLVEQAKKLPHDDFDQYLRAFQSGLQHYNCQSKENWGHHWYKGSVEKNIQGLQKTYPKLTNPKHQQEAIDIAAHLSKLYQYQHWYLLLRYLALQNRLIKLKISAGVAVGNEIHYDKYQ